MSRRQLIERALRLLPCIALTACSDGLAPELQDLPRIENIGIAIDAYDAQTNRAGDITFEGGSTFIPFGKLIEGNDGSLKRTPELTFYVAEGTPVRAPITGVVTQIDVLYSGDNLIILRQPPSEWEVGVEHVVDPLVRVGDEVIAGEIIATATPEPTPWGTIAFTELAVWFPADSDEEMIKKCPFLAFDEALQAEFETDIMRLVGEWEDYWGEDVFDEQSWALPGCVIEEMTEAEGRNPGG